MDSVAQFVGTPANATEFWAMVEAIATLVGTGLAGALLFVAIKGLRSLRLTRIDMVNRATRESRFTAIERCREMADKIIPAQDEVARALSARGVPVFIKDPRTVAFGGKDEHDARQRAATWVQSIGADPALYWLCVNHLNQLESWAMFFTRGLAESETAEKPCAPLFNAIIIQLYPLIVHLRADEQAGDFPNLVQLFEVWYGEKIRPQNDAEAQALLARVVHYQTKEYPKLPDPIGTKVD